MARILGPLQTRGVYLAPLSLNHLEQVRIWRNSPEIQQFMDFKGHISPEMQLEWFEKVINNGDLYYVIYSDAISVGLINLKDFNFDSAEFGIFIGNIQSQHTLLPVISSILLFSNAFKQLNITKLYSHVLDSNARAIRFNKGLGFMPTSTISSSYNRLYTMTKEHFTSIVLPKYQKLLH